jgi:predicted metalloendopeptidase
LPDAGRAARGVFALETAVAGHHWDKVTSRDREKTYNLFTWSGLLSEGPDLRRWLAAWTRRLAPATRSCFASRALPSRMQRARLA